MFVCLCSGITEKQIIEAVKAGESSIEALSARLGVGMNCGSCINYTQDLIQQHYDPAKDAAVFYQVA